MEIVKLNTKKKAPDGLAKELRDLADLVDKGEVVEVVAAYNNGEEYGFIYGASLQTGYVMSGLLNRKILMKFDL